MADVLVYSERTDLYPELLGKARELAKALGGGAAAALIGPGGSGAADLARNGADKVVVVSGDGLERFEALRTSEAIAAAAAAVKPAAVLVSSTRRGKELAGPLAQRLGGTCATDVTSLAVEGGAMVFQRYNLGGNTVTRAEARGPCPVFACMPKSFEPAPAGSSSGAVVQVKAPAGRQGLKYVESKSKEGESVNLEDAKVLVCVGKGFSSKEELAPAFELAKRLGGEVGCTREPATDFHWMSEERVVGLSGKKVSPNLYVGIGISGQIQHTVGIVGAKCVVVVNKDKDAPFFQVSDYGVVADWKEFMPQFLAALKK